MGKIFGKKKDTNREIREYFDYLQTPHESFGGIGMSFLKSEISNNKLMIEIYGS